MIELSRWSLNRIVSPALSLEEFFDLAAGLGVRRVELRNDLPGVGIIDEMEPERVRESVSRRGIEILTINALQKFNLGALRAMCMRELASLVTLAKAIGCGAIVLCPNNDVQDRRSQSEIFRETVDSLSAFAPLLADGGVLGFIEPLGFEECSLRSKATALRAIGESGTDCYRIVHDTFHHAIGPDASTEKGIEVSAIGLVHLSGVEAPPPAGGYRDAHRLLVTNADRLDNRGQLRVLDEAGYRGPLSFEPFAEAVQRLPPPELRNALRQSIDFLSA